MSARSCPTAEAIAAAAAVVLAIIGLAGMIPRYALAIAAIAAGAAVLFEGGAIAARLSRLLESRATPTIEKTEIGGGVAMDGLAGIAGVVLGVLALIGVAPLTLMAVAAIVYGGALLFSSSALEHLNQRSAYGESRHVARDAIYVSAGGQALAGIAAVVLGILALLGMEPYTLAIIAMLVVGGSTLMSSAAVGTKLFSILKS